MLDLARAAEPCAPRSAGWGPSDALDPEGRSVDTTAPSLARFALPVVFWSNQARYGVESLLSRMYEQQKCFLLLYTLKGP